ncbi:MAG TPA: hypothetical protein VMT15_18995 [Bryobacteraceae bacterium]|nr:hypothetical protein [Bryobacteraceae bacterium]
MKRNLTLLLGLLALPIFAQDQARPTAAQVQQMLEQAAQNDAQSQPVMEPIPAQLTIKAGTYVTVRLNEILSSERSMVGDAFTAALAKPIVVNGVVIALRGQNVTGRVTEVKKSGHFGVTSRLGIQLVDLPVVDGQQVAVQSEFITLHGASSTGRDVAGLATTTGVGAAIGAGVGGGVGAAVGAGAGLFAGAAGVVLTRGNPTVIFPETTLTFRVTQNVTVSTEKSVQAFRYVQPSDYEEPAGAQPRMARRPPPRPAYGYGYPYPYPYYPYYWGPSLYFGYGGRRW